MREMRTLELRQIVDIFIRSEESVKSVLETRDREMEAHYKQHPDDTDTLISGYDNLHSDAFGLVMCLKHLLREEGARQDYPSIKVAEGRITTIDNKAQKRLKDLRKKKPRQAYEVQNSQSRRTDVGPWQAELPPLATDSTLAPPPLPRDQAEEGEIDPQFAAKQSLSGQVAPPPVSREPAPSSAAPTPTIPESTPAPVAPAQLEARRPPSADEVNRQRKLLADLTKQSRSLSDTIHEILVGEILDVPSANEEEYWALKDRHEILEHLRDQLQTRKSNYFDPATKACQALISELADEGQDVDVYREVLEFANVEGVVILERILKAHRAKVAGSRDAVNPRLQELLDNLESEGQDVGVYREILEDVNVEGASILEMLLDVKIKKIAETRDAVDHELQALLDSLESEVNQKVLDVRLRIVPYGVISFARELIAGSADPHELRARERTVEELIDLVREYVSG